MPKLLRVSERHQITIPPDVMRDAGLTEGSYVAVQARGGKIILEPKAVSEQEFSKDDFEKLDELVRRQNRAGRYTEYPNAKEAKKHLKR